MSGNLTRPSMARPNLARTALPLAVASALLLLVAMPAAISLSNGSGAVCLADSTCPLSALNPCVRKPSFAVVGRCALDIR